MQPLLALGVRLSTDGRGRCLDNVFVGRLWRSAKYAEIYLKSYHSLVDAHTQLGTRFQFYNECRPHSALGGDVTPGETYPKFVSWKNMLSALQ